MRSDLVRVKGIRAGSKSATAGNPRLHLLVSGGPKPAQYKRQSTELAVGEDRLV